MAARVVRQVAALQAEREEDRRQLASLHHEREEDRRQLASLRHEREEDRRQAAAQQAGRAEALKEVASLQAARDADQREAASLREALEDARTPKVSPVRAVHRRCWVAPCAVPMRAWRAAVACRSHGPISAPPRRGRRRQRCAVPMTPSAAPTTSQPKAASARPASPGVALHLQPAHGVCTSGSLNRRVCARRQRWAWRGRPSSPWPGGSLASTALRARWQASPRACCACPACSGERSTPTPPAAGAPPRFAAAAGAPTTGCPWLWALAAGASSQSIRFRVLGFRGGE